MKEDLFRKTSIDRIATPEHLNEHIKVATPNLWIILGVVVVFLAGIILWGIFGRIETTLQSVAVTYKNDLGVVQTNIYVKDENISKVKVGQSVYIGNAKVTITNIPVKPEVLRSEDVTKDLEYILYVGNLKIGDWIYTIATDGQLSEGVESAKIAVETINPISFVFG